MVRIRDVVWGAVVASCGVGAGAENVKVASQMRAVHLRVDDTVGDLLEHPAFAGFGRLLLPRDDRRVETTMRLREIGALLPYHTHVDPAVVVSSLNRMIDDAAAGRTVFHDFYTAAEKSSPMKAKGVAELGLCGVGAAVANAVYNATGVRVRGYPITLEKHLERLPPVT